MIKCVICDKGKLNWRDMCLPIKQVKYAEKIIKEKGVGVTNYNVYTVSQVFVEALSLYAKKYERMDLEFIVEDKVINDIDYICQYLSKEAYDIIYSLKLELDFKYH